MSTPTHCTSQRLEAKSLSGHVLTKADSASYSQKRVHTRMLEDISQKVETSSSHAIAFHLMIQMIHGLMVKALNMS